MTLTARRGQRDKRSAAAGTADRGVANDREMTLTYSERHLDI